MWPIFLNGFKKTVAWKFIEKCSQEQKLGYMETVLEYFHSTMYCIGEDTISLRVQFNMKLSCSQRANTKY